MHLDGLTSGTQEGCHFDHSTQSAVAKLLREALDARNLSSLVAASDENTYDQGLATWKSFDSSTKAAIAQVRSLFPLLSARVLGMPGTLSILQLGFVSSSVQH